MPITRNYSGGSIIYFEGDKSNSIYILKGGKVKMTYTNDLGEEVTEVVKEGEFFGVKSSLARVKREETVQVLQDSEILVMSLEEFEKMAIRNHRLVMKMLRVFSNQLRRIGKQVNKYLSKQEVLQPEVELFKIGDYYLKNKKFDSAIYAFAKYIEHYPNGTLIARAKERISLAQKGISHGFKPIGETEEVAEEQEKKVSEEPAETPAIGEEDAVPSSEFTEDMDLTKIFYDGVNLASEGNFEKAMKTFLQVKESPGLESDPSLSEKLELEIGECYVSLEQYQVAISVLTNLIKKFPKTENMKNILFNLGRCYKETGDTGKAKAFYQKVVNTPPNEPINMKAKKALEELEPSQQN